ncbi:MAG: cache domain-containing protein [Rhizobiales bacterium]|nr:cache domain-containing protein [Hyphomicrobiales bacterium]
MLNLIVKSVKAQLAILVTICIASTSSEAMAQSISRGTPSEAIAMAKDVIKKFKNDGLEKTLHTVNHTQIFRDRDLYAFIMNNEGVIAAHGVLQALVGKNIIRLVDGDGKLMIQEFVDVMKVKRTGWVDYKWPNFVTGKLDFKSTYLERMDENHFVGVGIYQAKKQ